MVISRILAVVVVVLLGSVGTLTWNLRNVQAENVKKGEENATLTHQLEQVYSSIDQYRSQAQRLTAAITQRDAQYEDAIHSHQSVIQELSKLYEKHIDYFNAAVPDDVSHILRQYESNPAYHLPEARDPSEPVRKEKPRTSSEGQG